MDEISATNRQSKTTPQRDDNAPLNTVQTTMDRFLSAANVEAVYGSPIREGETIVIPAAEVVSVAGFGYGSGGGPQRTDENSGSGEGGGGGGRVFSRPVAAVVITPTGVRVEPIVDVTKIALAFFTTLGFMASLLTRMRNTKAPDLQ